MMKTITRLITACIALLALNGTPAWASSPFLYGTILKVEPGTDGGVTVQVLVLIDNYKRGPEFAIRTLTLRAGIPICLDWKVATYADALAPGRSFVHYMNHSVVLPDGEAIAGKRHKKPGGAILVSTAPAPLVPVALTAAGCELLIATLDKPNLEGLALESTKKAITAHVILELAEGRIVAGAMLSPALEGAVWHDIDATGLAFEAGVLSGSVKVTYQGSDGRSAEASYALQGAADGRGTYAGTHAGDAISGRLAVLGIAPHRPGGSARVWLWSQDDRFVGTGAKTDTWSSLSWRFEDGSADTGYTCFRKGYVNGTLADATLSLDGTSLQGAFTAKSLGAAEGVKVLLDGRVLAGCVAVATLRVGEKPDAVRVYGFLMHPDAAPPVLPGSEAKAQDAED